jgi:phage FluMu protein Com
MMKTFRCCMCNAVLHRITALSHEYWWYKCHKCSTEASHWGPEWEHRFDLTNVMVVKEVNHEKNI